MNGKTNRTLPMAAGRLIVRYANPLTLATAAADRILLTMSDLLDQPGRQRVDCAVTGGTDGMRVLEAIARNPLRATVDWSRVHFWWGDERFVAADDPNRNALQARQALLDELMAGGSLPETNIHEMPTDSRSAEERARATDIDNLASLKRAARQYEAELVRDLKPEPGELPHLDIAWFGVGPEGHFASLFPNDPLLKETVRSAGAVSAGLSSVSRLVAPVMHSPKPPALRLTMTPVLIRSARNVWITASSGRKRTALTTAATLYDDPHWPVSFAGGTDSTIWMVDEAAMPSTGELAQQ
ncbi:MAG: 6-phosphogluconolactonase [Bifidobacteriaceae bacterium]|nr:6-phosphogluconolactonase [Bifidobacteriaceae bacterium]